MAEVCGYLFVHIAQITSEKFEDSPLIRRFLYQNMTISCVENGNFVQIVVDQQKKASFGMRMERRRSCPARSLHKMPVVVDRLIARKGQGTAPFAAGMLLN